MTAFSHRDRGNDLTVWRPVHEGAAALRLPRQWRRLIVLAAHPDDETLGAAGLIRRAGREGREVEVVVATDGEASHPDSPTHSRDRLAATRRTEVREATGLLAPRRRLHLLGLPDGRLAECAEELLERLVELVGRDGAGTVIAAPWRRDGHTDHEIAGQVAAITASRTDAVLLEYPIWFWHWGTPDDQTRPEFSRLELDQADRAAKSEAMAGHRSQVHPLSHQPGDEVLLDSRVLDHFRGDELFVVDQPVQDDAFERLHTRDPDPWSTASSSYEADKRSATIAALGGRRFSQVLEVGCSVGGLTADLADIGEQVTALDASPRAIELARGRLRERGVADRVRLACLRVPQQWPDGRFDLVVVSEVGYFLSPRGLDGLVERIRQCLEPGGLVVLCHWLHEIRGWPLDGDAVHDRVLADDGWQVSSVRRTPDYRLDVLQRADD